jgi:hypothetical protein
MVDLSPIRLSVPCTPEHAQVVRTTAAAVGATAGFTIDGLDDLRLIVDEVFGSMCTLGVLRVEMSLVGREGMIGVQMSAAAPVAAPRSPPDVGVATLLAAVLATDVRVELRAALPTFEATVTDRR